MSVIWSQGVELLNSKKREWIMKNELVGWDDGKIYFYDEAGKEHCVNDDDELFKEIMEFCKIYFKEKDETGNKK